MINTIKLIAAVVCMQLVLAVPAHAGGETKEVCHDQKDKQGKLVKDKNGETRQTCKKIKVHKIVEGEKVPQKK